MKHALLVVMMSSACMVGDDAEHPDEGSLAAAANSNVFKRVVLGRLYQTDRWMLPAADTYRAAEFPDLVDRRIHYVCDVVAPLEPTYVSGLVRLSWDTVITDDMRRVFRGVKQCVRDQVTQHPVSFDVVLNAKHYTEPRAQAEKPEDGVASDKEGRERIYERLRTGNEALDPEIWFFDFYSQPFNDESENWHESSLVDGIARIHGGGRLVGGNVWGSELPPHSDFAAIPLIGGIEGQKDKIAKLQAQKPTLIHIRNDPQVCDSEGLEWFEYSPERRGDMIANHASKQAELNAGYMYPAFFPLTATPECAKPGEKQVAYDVKADGLANRLKTIMDREAYRPR